MPDDSEVTAEVTNISRSGFTAYAERPISPSISLGVALPGHGIHRADVRWVQGLEFGARFDRDLTDKQFGHL